MVLSFLRRRLTAGALALCLLPIAAPLTAGAIECHRGAAAGVVECCPAGAHPDGQCPMHRSTPKSECRLSCGATNHAASALFGPIGILVNPPSLLADTLSAVTLAPSAAPASFRPSVPDSPPPR
ncbi:MAG TPA: hypothetical protein VFK20_11645 [Vicinamibacterales bacterium]|nr:hypothetical protein [Vicinamibacterales bacterium]